MPNDPNGCETCLMGERACWKHDPSWRPSALSTRTRKRYLGQQSVLLPLHDSCVICQNEGRHGSERPHVMEGQE